MSTQLSPNGNIKKTLEIAGMTAKKSLGQNFLHDSNIIKKMVEAGKATKNDVVVEIGPGLGNTTKEIARCSKKIIAIEKDEEMAGWLSTSLKELGIENVEIIIGDAIKELKNPKSKLNTVLPKKYKVIANIPYYLTSHIIRLLLERQTPPQSITLMIQKEVAERICDKSNNSLLSISISYYADAKLNFTVSKNCFHPKPKIDSAIITLTPKKKIRDEAFDKIFFLLLKTGFSSPRKQLLKNLTRIGDRIKIETILRESGIDNAQRAETLNLDDWTRLANSYLKSAN